MFCINIYTFSFILNGLAIGFLAYSNYKLYKKLEDLYRKINYHYNYINCLEPIPEVQIINQTSDVIMTNNLMNQKKEYIVL